MIIKKRFSENAIVELVISEIENIGGEIVHTHPEYGEYEFMLDGVHYLLEVEDMNVTLCVVEEISKFPLEQINNLSTFI